MSPGEHEARARRLRRKRDFLGACALLGIVMASVALQHRPPAQLYYLFFPGAILFAIPSVEAALWILSKSEDVVGIRVWYSVPAFLTLLLILMLFATFLIPARLFALHLEYKRTRAAAPCSLPSPERMNPMPMLRPENLLGCNLIVIGLLALTHGFPDAPSPLVVAAVTLVTTHSASYLLEQLTKAR